MDAFSGCRMLTEVTIPASVTEIEPSAFSLCMRLKKVTIGEGVTIIGSGAFSHLRALESVYFKGDAPHMEVPTSSVLLPRSITRPIGGAGATPSAAGRRRSGAPSPRNKPPLANQDRGCRGAGWGGLPQESQRSLGVLVREIQTHQSCFLRLPWSAENVFHPNPSPPQKKAWIRASLLNTPRPAGDVNATREL